MGQIKNIKLHIVTDIKMNIESPKYFPESYPALGPCISESFPSLGHRSHHVKPKLLSCKDSKLMLTPEKEKEVKEHKTSKQPQMTKRKVTFNENVLDAKPTDSASHLSHPLINSTNSLRSKILQTRSKKLDLSEQVLKEVSLNVPNEKVNLALNYKLTDKKYNKLTSISVDSNEIVKPKSLYQEKSKDEDLRPHIMDLWCSKEFSIERYYFDHQNLFLDEAESTEEETDCDFLCEMYEAD